MWQLLSRLRKRRSAAPRTTAPRALRRTRLEVETLEGRLVLSGFPTSLGANLVNVPGAKLALVNSLDATAALWGNRPGQLGTVAPPASAETPNERFVVQLWRDLSHSSLIPNWQTVTDLAAKLDQHQLTRIDVARQFIFSAAYAQVVVQDLFQSMLHRDYNPQTDSALAGAYLAAVPQAGAMQPWVGQPHSTLATVEDLAVAIATTPEYFQTRGGGTLSGWVTAVYADGLQRSPTAAERAAAHGTGPDRTVADAVFHSQDHQMVEVTTFYQHFLHRPLDPAGQTYWQGRYSSGIRSEEVLAEILQSDEYYMDCQQ